jgi:tetratricopeptide (TPR) repeat protein
MKPIEQALSAHRAGNLDEAEKLYRAVLARDARDFDALHMLGIICAQQQKYAEAEQLIGKALAIDARVPQAMHNYANVLSKLKRYEEAIRYYDKILALAPNIAPVHSDRGNAKREIGQIEDAIASYQRAIALNPNFTAALCNLAQALVDLYRLDEAEALVKRAMAVDPNYPSAARALGRIAFERGDLTAALTATERAIALNPDEADAYNDLGNTLRDLGRLEEANAAYEKSIALRPDQTPLYFGLVDNKKLNAGDPHIAALEKIAANAESLPPLERIFLDFSLGKAYADSGEQRRSFACFIAGNAAKRGTLTYDEQSMFDQFKRIEQTFTPEFMAKKAGGGDPSRRPIFVIGMPRSGTTLIEQLIASHPAVMGAGELTIFSDAVAAARPAGSGVPFPDYLLSFRHSDLTAIGGDYLKRLANIAPQGERVTDKLPQNFFLAGLIHLALPNAVIIHSMRDPVDTCVSCFTRLFRRDEQPYTYDLGELGRYYMRYQHLMDHWQRVLPAGRTLDVRYEDVVADVEGQARRLLAHCGLDWDERVLAFHKSERPVRTASASQVRQPIYASAVGRWRAYGDLLAPLLTALNISAA